MCLVHQIITFESVLDFYNTFSRLVLFGKVSFRKVGDNICGGNALFEKIHINRVILDL